MIADPPEPTRRPVHGQEWGERHRGSLFAFLVAIPIGLLGGLIGLGGAEFRLPGLARPLGYAARASSWRRPRVSKADLMHAIYERITVAVPEVVGVRLTAAAYAHGLALALPEAVMARPTGFEPADAIRFVRIPILQRHRPSVQIA